MKLITCDSKRRLKTVLRDIRRRNNRGESLNFTVDYRDRANNVNHLAEVRVYPKDLA